ncbi:hypothetical protein GE061_004823 [Apolygus lucorum]|uniref:Uncharacterized protein n=1 Tax=Apolygus lucorum TaxID=248454 RepID=A0A6A4J014_APOLU|nr:hypothetical protein GE061_004823 [Apolygus lucorum]
MRRSDRLRTKGDRPDIINLVSDEEDNSGFISVPLPIIVSERGNAAVRRTEIKREIAENSPIVNQTVEESRDGQSIGDSMKSDEDDRSESDLSALNFSEMLDKVGSQNILRKLLNVESKALGNGLSGSCSYSSAETPVAERLSLTRTMGNASFFGQDGLESAGPKEGPLLILWKRNQVAASRSPTITELPQALPNAQNPTPFEPLPDLCRQKLRRSPSGDWLKGGGQQPEPFGKEAGSPPAKKCRKNEEEDTQNQPSCSYPRRNSESSYSETESEYDDDDDSINNPTPNSYDNKKSKKTSKNSQKKQKIHEKVRSSSRGKVMCKTCGAPGHRNIVSDRVKANITKKLFKFGLSADQQQPAAAKSLVTEHRD